MLSPCVCTSYRLSSNEVEMFPSNHRHRNEMMEETCKSESAGKIHSTRLANVNVERFACLVFEVGMLLLHSKFYLVIGEQHDVVQSCSEPNVRTLFTRNETWKEWNDLNLWKNTFHSGELQIDWLEKQFHLDSTHANENNSQAWHTSFEWCRFVLETKSVTGISSFYFPNIFFPACVSHQLVFPSSCSWLLLSWLSKLHTNQLFSYSLLSTA